MLFHLVYNEQLKKPLKKIPSKTYVLVHVNGKMYTPLDVLMVATAVKGPPLATFEIQGNGEAGVLATATSFDELFSYFRDQFIPAIDERAIAKVFKSQSLTITFVIKQLGIPRADAKEFIMRCVNMGAYKKYYSYWVRTDVFSSWLIRHEVQQ